MQGYIVIVETYPLLKIMLHILEGILLVNAEKAFAAQFNYITRCPYQKNISYI